MHFNVKGINGKCEFKQIDMRDGLRLSGYATKLHSGSVEDSADAMEKIGDIALKYLYVDDQQVGDIAGLCAVSEENNSFVLTEVTLKFMELFESFL